MPEECERAKFLASLGVDVAKLCDKCAYDDSQHTCFALEEIRSHNDAFVQIIKKNKVDPGADDLSKIVNTKTFIFDVRTTMGHYAIVSPTYANASETVREETREPVLSVRKCSE